jgi:serine/threonine protein kinase
MRTHWSPWIPLGRIAMPPMILLDEGLVSDDETLLEELDGALGDDDVLEDDEPVEDDIDLPPGTIIGGVYRVIGPLGAGSMGIVVLAHDETLDRRVAIKFTRPGLLSTSFGERFLAEAQAMARVSHPNVLQVHSYGEHDGAPYFVMEFVQGRTLEQWLAERRSPPDLDLALRILDDVCRGASAIHAANTVHHDIKPSNILLDDQLRPRIADLGLAVLCRQDQPRRGELGGTPAYMAPEIAFGRDIDPALRLRADVYSLGCVAYELLTGRPPFDGAGNMGILLQHAMRPVVPPSTLRADLPPELDRAVLQALAKNPIERTSSADALRRNLSAARRGSCEPSRILVADDDEDSREALQLMLALEFPDAEIECVPDGLAALAAFNRAQPSVTILDLRMPGIDGMKLTELLRERGSSAAMPIIILTASGGPEEWRRLASLGADRFLVKPVILDDVAALVRRALGERSSGVLQVVA